jgi:hypothetical protein
MFDSNRQLDFVSIVRNMPNRENRFENSYFSLSFSVLLTNVEKKKSNRKKIKVKKPVLTGAQAETAVFSYS